MDERGRRRAMVPAALAMEMAEADSERDVAAVIERWTSRLSPEQRTVAAALGERHVDLLRRIDEAGALAMVDPLTGAANRRAFSGRGDQQIEGWKSELEPFALGILDIDRFKEVNDRFGHTVGDTVLRMLVETVQRQCRADDVMARIGGEEFAILITGASEEEAMVVFERIRRSVEDLAVPTPAGAVTVTASIGVTTAGRGDTTVDALFDRADAALYAAKAAGRNRVVFRPPAEH